LVTMAWLITLAATAMPCAQGISCADTNLGLLCFVSIPFLSLMAFTAIVVLLLVARRGAQDE